ncbi:MAG: MFS transporter [Candidatus Njordarchaeia archaeon]
MESEESESTYKINYWIMVASWMVLGPTWVITGTYFQHYIRGLGGSDVIISLVASISTLILAFARIIGGYLADTIGRKAIILPLTFVLAFINLIYFIAWSWEIVLIAVIINNIILLYQPALDAILADSISKEKRGVGYGLSNFLVGILSPVSTFLAIYLISKYGVVEGVRIGYLISFGLTLSAGFLRIKLKETVKPIQVKKLSFKHFIGEYTGSLHIIRERLPGYLLLLIMFNAIIGLTVLTPIYVTYYLGFGEEIWGYYSFISGMLGWILAIPLGFLVDKVGRKFGLFISVASLMASNFVLFMMHTLPKDVILLFGVGLIGGISWTAWSSAASALWADLVPKSVRGRISAITNLLGSISYTISGIFGGIIYHSLGAEIPFLWSAIISILVLGVLIFMIPETRAKKLINKDYIW